MVVQRRANRRVLVSQPLHTPEALRQQALAQPLALARVQARVGWTGGDPDPRGKAAI